MKEERFTIPNPNGAGYRIPACRGRELPDRVAAGPASYIWKHC